MSKEGQSPDTNCLGNTTPQNEESFDQLFSYNRLDGDDDQQHDVDTAAGLKLSDAAAEATIPSTSHIGNSADVESRWAEWVAVRHKEVLDPPDTATIADEMMSGQNNNLEHVQSRCPKNWMAMISGSKERWSNPLHQAATIASILNANHIGGHDLESEIIDVTNSNLWLAKSSMRIREGDADIPSWERQYQIYDHDTGKTIHQLNFSIVKDGPGNGEGGEQQSSNQNQGRRRHGNDHDPRVEGQRRQAVRRTTGSRKQ